MGFDRLPVTGQRSLYTYVRRRRQGYGLRHTVRFT